MVYVTIDFLFLCYFLSQLCLECVARCSHLNCHLKNEERYTKSRNLAQNSWTQYRSLVMLDYVTHVDYTWALTAKKKQKTSSLEFWKASALPGVVECYSVIYFIISSMNMSSVWEDTKYRMWVRRMFSHLKHLLSYHNHRHHR